MKHTKFTQQPKGRYANQAESRLIEIQRRNMAELEKKLGLNCTTKKPQRIEVPNKGKPITDEQILKQNKAIDRLTWIEKKDFILETNKQSVIEAYYKLKN